MTDDVLLIEDRNRVRTITLNRPDALNSFNEVQYHAVAKALDDAADDDGVACVVITGAGRAFCAGQDLSEMGQPQNHNENTERGFPTFMSALDSFSKPLIAAVNGLGIGIGLTMLPYCDFVLIAESARLRAPFTQLGVTAEAGSTFMLPLTIGTRHTADILYTSRWINAQEAAEMGLAGEVLPDDGLMGRVRELADVIAAQPIASLKITKTLLVESRLAAARAARAKEDDLFATLSGGPANQEALAAFKEKRNPDFSKL